VPKDKHHLILGSQGQLWTEYMSDLNHVFYMAYPRACALAEVLWTKKDKHNYMDFLMRLNVYRQRLLAMGEIIILYLGNDVKLLTVILCSAKENCP